jgi:Uma2 family endonuclease
MAEPTASHDSLTVEEYLKLEESATVRHEYLGSEIFAMVGATKRHNRIGRVAFGQIAPWSPRTQDAQDAVEHVPRVTPGPTSTVHSARRVGDQRPQNLPLLVGKVHAPPQLEELNA